MGGRGDPGPGDGGERHAGKVHRTSTEEGPQLQADAKRRGVIPIIERRMDNSLKLLSNGPHGPKYFDARSLLNALGATQPKKKSSLYIVGKVCTINYDCIIN